MMTETFVVPSHSPSISDVLSIWMIDKNTHRQIKPTVTGVDCSLPESLTSRTVPSVVMKDIAACVRPQLGFLFPASVE